jgi:hypothetical protein
VPNKYVCALIRSYSKITKNSETLNSYKTELDSHANMAVIGRHSIIINDTGKTADVKPFSPDCNTLQKVKIIDAAIKWTCPNTDVEYILLVMNALYVPANENNLTPPFLMREAGIVVNDVPKIHMDNPQVEDHSLYFKEKDLRIPMSLDGIFSYFPTDKPTVKDIEECENILYLTPESTWDPHTDVYARNEANMVDHEGNMKEKKHRMKIMLSEVTEDETLHVNSAVSVLEATTVDKLFENREALNPDTPTKHAMDPGELCSLMAERHTDAQFTASVGATHPCMRPYLFDEVTVETVDNSDDEDDECNSTSSDNDDNEDSDEEFDTHIDCEDEDALDAFMARATHAEKPKGVSAEDLSKVWKIDVETARKTLNVTSQNCNRTNNPNLSRNYSTNDRMLRYKRISQYFFMDTFFATSKGGKSSRGNTCVQLFVTDKGFIYVVPMKRKGDVLQALKQFAKEIGAPDAIICDAAREQKSAELKRFCNDMGTTLRVLEEGTPWANKAELYIGLIKEAVRKDMKDADSPIPCWDYCVER